MKNSAERKKRFLEKAENIFDTSKGLLRDLPQIILHGNTEIEIDNFKGLLDFSSSSMRINTSDGIIRIEGSLLAIVTMTDETVMVKGTISAVNFE